jgi:hypothetical protein
MPEDQHEDRNMSDQIHDVPAAVGAQEPPRFSPTAAPAAPDPQMPVASPTTRFAADLAAPRRFGADKFDVEARLIELAAALAAAQQLFKALEHDFYHAAFGRYDD